MSYRGGGGGGRDLLGGGGRGGPPGGGRGGGGGGRFGGGGGGRGGGMSEQTAMQDLRSIFQGLTFNVAPKEVNGMAARPGTGTKGQEVRILANHFKIPDVASGLVLCQYDIAMDRVKMPGEKERERQRARAPAPEGPPPMPPRPKCFAVMNKLAQGNGWPTGKWAYDGQKQLWTVGPFLAPQTLTFFVELEDASARTAEGAAARADTGRPLPKYEVVIKPADNGVLHVGRELAAFRQRSEDMPRESMQALDVALRQGATQDPANRMLGRGIYTNVDCAKLGFGLEAWHGYIQSLNTVQSGLTVSMDPAVVAVPIAEELIDWMREIVGEFNQPRAQFASRPLTKQQIDRLNEEVRRNVITIEITHRSTGNLKRKVRGFTQQSTRDSMFTTSEGRSLSVETYFKETYKNGLKYPLLPCMVSGSASRNPESSKRPEWIPVEVCRILPEIGKRGLTGEQTSKILSMAAVPPQARQQKTLDTLVKKARLASDATARGFDLKVDAQPTLLAVPGRLLPAPRLKYGSSKCMNPGDRGAWNLMDTQLLSPVVMESFAVVCYVPRHRVEGGGHMDRFLNTLDAALQEKGITVRLPQYPPVIYKERNMSDYQVLKTAVDEATSKLRKPPQILFIIQERENQVYNDIKKICDCDLGVQSQLLVAPNIALTAPGDKIGSKLAGVVLKVNMKLAGDNAQLTGNISNWCPTLARMGAGGGPARVMMLGADVTHPTNLPGQGKTDPNQEAKRPDQPSIAAVVASTNLDCTQFASRIMAQNPLQEFIEDMEKAVFELLNVWLRANKTLPDVIMMFRDGVSEGQFRPVLGAELAAIKAACARFKNKQGVPFTPKVTFTTVQKRHQTRLYPGERNADDGKTGNIRPGIVVDKEICHPSEFDFYLCSHAGIQGTNKPAKYSVLSDEVGFSADAMQLLVYWLCHTFCRCSRSVSYVPPAYYAHHAAFRGRAWLRRIDMSDTMSTSSAGTGGSGPGWTWEFSRPHDAIKDTMFFI